MRQGLLGGSGTESEPFVISAENAVASAAFQRLTIEKIFGENATTLNRQYHDKEHGVTICEHRVSYNNKTISVWFDLTLVDTSIAATKKVHKELGFKSDLYDDIESEDELNKKLKRAAEINSRLLMNAKTEEEKGEALREAMRRGTAYSTYPSTPEKNTKQQSENKKSTPNIHNKDDRGCFSAAIGLIGAIIITASQEISWPLKIAVFIGCFFTLTLAITFLLWVLSKIIIEIYKKFPF